MAGLATVCGVADGPVFYLDMCDELNLLSSSYPSGQAPMPLLPLMWPQAPTLTKWLPQAWARHPAYSVVPYGSSVLATTILLNVNG